MEAEKRTNRASIDSEVSNFQVARLFGTRLCGNNKETATYVTVSP